MSDLSAIDVDDGGDRGAKCHVSKYHKCILYIYILDGLEREETDFSVCLSFSLSLSLSTRASPRGHPFSELTPTRPSRYQPFQKMRAVGAVVVRSYIAGLRGRIKELENELRVAEDGDEHAHFHGHEKCTADHGHGGSDHGDEEMEEGHDHGHDHGHGEKCTADHGHHDHGHKEEEHSHDGHDHGHTHKEEEHSHDGHDHGHAHKEETGPRRP